MAHLLVFLGISVFLVLVILVATYFINIPTNDYEKHSAYECGFEPFGDARSFFDIHFYTVGLLFIIFDLEVVFLIPAVVDIANISFFGYVNFILVILIILVGFYYEWALGLLNWLPPKLASRSDNSAFFLISIVYLVLEEADTTYLVFMALITFSLCSNLLSNLIQRVLNLAVLSLIVVATWLYATELMYPLIAYIIAFLGAIVMLFLSVVLMLPSSVISKQDLPSPVLCSTIVVMEEASLTSWSYKYVLFFFFAWLIYIFLVYVTDFEPQDLLQFKEHMAKFLSNSLEYISVGVESPSNFLLFCKFVFYKTLEVLGIFSGITVPADLVGHYTTKPRGEKYMPRYSNIAIYLHDLQYFFYINVELKLYRLVDRSMYKKIFPTWKAFRKFETLYCPARHVTKQQFIPDLSPRFYIPIRFKHSIFNILPVIPDVPKIPYVQSKRFNTTTNRIIFLINAITLIIAAVLYNTALVIQNSTWFVLLSQSIGSLSVFVVALPFSFIFSDIKHSNFLVNWVSHSVESQDSLIAIKEIIYTENPVFTFISIMALLVALIGAATFNKSNN